MNKIRKNASFEDKKTVVIVFDAQRINVDGIYTDKEDADKAIFRNTINGKVLAVTFEASDATHKTYNKRPRIDFKPFCMDIRA